MLGAFEPVEGPYPFDLPTEGVEGGGMHYLAVAHGGGAVIGFVIDEDAEQVSLRVFRVEDGDVDFQGGPAGRLFAG